MAACKRGNLYGSPTLFEPLNVSIRLSFLLLFPLLVLGQPPVGAPATWSTPEPILSFAVDTVHPDGGERQSLELEAELKYRKGWQHVLKPGLSYGVETYDFDGSAAEIEEANYAELGLSYLHFTPTGWSFFGRGELGFAAEDSGELTDDPAPLVILGAGRKLGNPRGRVPLLGLALIAQQDIEEDWRVFPVPQIEWPFPGDWMLKTERGLLFEKDAGGPARYGFGLDYLNRRFRAEDGRVVEYNAAPVYLRAEKDLSESLTISGRVGAVVWGELEIDDVNGRGIDDEDFDPGFHAAVQAVWTLP